VNERETEHDINARALAAAATVTATAARYQIGWFIGARGVYRTRPGQIRLDPALFVLCLNVGRWIYGRKVVSA